MLAQPSSFVITLFQQIAFLSAVLGGFAAAFLGALLGVPAGRRLATAAIAATAVSAAAFVAVTLGATVIGLLAAQVGAETFGQLPPRAARAQFWTGWLFVAGVYTLLLGIGLSGWLRSRATGLCTAAAALLGSVAATAALFLAWG